MRIFITFILTLYCLYMTAQCPDKKCSDIYTEWGFAIQIEDPAYIPVITNTDENCYITLQSEIPLFNSILEKYNIINFYRYLENDNILSTSPDEWLNRVYILVCDFGQYQLGIDLQQNFPDAIPFIEQWECFKQLTEPGMGIDDATFKNNFFHQQGNMLIFSEIVNQPRTIHFYSALGMKIYSIQSMEKELNPIPFLNQKGIYIVEVIENGKKYSGYFINF